MGCCESTHDNGGFDKEHRNPPKFPRVKILTHNEELLLQRTYQEGKLQRLKGMGEFANWSPELLKEKGIAVHRDEDDDYHDLIMALSQVEDEAGRKNGFLRNGMNKGAFFGGDTNNSEAYGASP